MSLIPGPRTNPTIKPLASSRAGRSSRLALKLSPMQSVILLGLVMGCMACAFYLGYFSGQRVGFEIAFDNNLNNVFRVPLSAEGTDADIEQEFSGEAAAQAGSGRSLKDQGGSDPIYAALSQRGDSADKISDDSGRSDKTALVVAKALNAAEKAAKSEQAVIEKILLDHAQQNVRDSKAADIESEDTGGAAVIIGGGAISGGSHQIAGSNTTIGSLVASPPKAANEAKTNQVVVASEGIDSLGGSIPARGRAQIGSLVGDRNASAIEFKAKTSESLQPADLQPARAKEDQLAQKQDSNQQAVNSDKLGTSESVRPAAGGRYSEPSAGWYVQAAAPDTRSAAETLARGLANAGFPVRIESAKVRGQSYFRVLAGPESNRTQAERLLSQVKREPGIGAEPFIRQIK